MNNRDAIQFSSDSIFLLLKAKNVLIKEYNIILFVLILAQNLIYTVWGTGLGCQGGQISNINRSENHKSTVDPGTTLALITNQMLLLVQVQKFSAPCDKRYGVVHRTCKGERSCVQKRFWVHSSPQIWRTQYWKKTKFIDNSNS